MFDSPDIARKHLFFKEPFQLENATDAYIDLN